MTSTRCIFCFSILLLTSLLSAAEKPPNVLLILSDDQAWTDYGFMGHPQIKTPHLDQLAAESLTFTRGYTPIALCRPALSTLATGLYPHDHGVIGNDPSLPERPKKGSQGRNDPALAPIYDAVIARFTRHPNMIQDLTAQGYLTLQTGKWWEGNPRETAGFTHAMTKGDPGRHGDVGLKISREGHAPIENFWADADAADKPWFIWHAPFLPHTPHTPPEELLEQYRKIAPNEGVARYWATVAWFDQTCGELLARLEERGERENTIVIYVCDNGWIQSPQPNRFAPLSKVTPYEGGTRSPIMVSWPGKITPHRDETHLASNIDVWPTIAGLLGTEIPDNLPGINLTDATAVADRQMIFGEQFDHDIANIYIPSQSLDARWVVAGDWKLIARQDRDGTITKLELFNLTNDPHEKKDLADIAPQRAKKMLTEITEWWSPHYPKPRGDKSTPL